MKLTPEIAALYIGCSVQTKIRRTTKSGEPMKKLKGELLEVDLGIKAKLGVHLEDEPDKCCYEYLNCSDVKLILRPISSITNAERKELIGLEVNPKEAMWIKIKGEYKVVGFSNISGISMIPHSTIITYWENFKNGKLRHRVIGYVDCTKPTIKQLLWLLNKRFDLFGLIADGAAQTKKIKQTIL